MLISDPKRKVADCGDSIASCGGPVAVGRLLAPIARKVLKRGGAPMAELIAGWAAIAGPHLAAYTRPAKLAKAPSDPAFPGMAPSYSLHLKVDPARALDVQYLVPQLIERINQALGYRAVSQLRIVQIPMAGAQRRSPPPARLSTAQTRRHAGDGRLQTALNRMAAGIGARAPLG